MKGEDLGPGTRVEVRNSFDGRWARGFEIAECVDQGFYRLRRVSDRRVLPAEFAEGDVRPERRRQGLWWA